MCLFQLNCTKVWVLHNKKNCYWIILNTLICLTKLLDKHINWKRENEKKLETKYYSSLQNNNNLKDKEHPFWVIIVWSFCKMKKLRLNLNKIEELRESFRKNIINKNYISLIIVKAFKKDLILTSCSNLLKINSIIFKEFFFFSQKN